MPRLFGEKLRALRTERQLTQAQLAEQLGLATQSHLSYLERGKSAPSVALAVRAAGVLGVTVDFLLRDTIPPDIPIASSFSPSQGDDVARQFGKRLRGRRTRSGMSQVQLAEHLQPLSQAYISLLESGQKAPSVETILRCADLFGVTADDLLLATLAGEEEDAQARTVHE
ncbi:helix-turn-helix transcriptional regulator [Chloroflexales bacterium ZM16-3]|nr:helix-turn-helix transcriptional regulator [Chloroflexales bacterium ZM16-3]